jgi:hypothetical protein
MNRLRRILLQLGPTALLAADLPAQSAQAISVQVSGLFHGSVFDRMESGYGGEAQLRYTPGALSVGAGFQYTTHGWEVGVEDIRLYGGFLEPRYRIHTGSNVIAPYVSARLSYLKIGFSGGDLSLSSSVLQVNGGGGVLYRLGSRLNLDLGATFGYNRSGSGTFSRESSGSVVPVESSTGTNLVVRLGFALGIGG